VHSGRYYLETSFIGYEKWQSSYFTIDRKHPSFHAGNIPLPFSAANLEEVTISGERNMMITRIDRKVFNVEKDLLAQTGTVTDVLQNIPSVSVDIDGNITLRGAGNVTILINGRPSVMGASATLEQMPASMIEKVEVITNPSAKYKPDGTGGIINIILKKEQKGGYNASLSVNAGNYDRVNATLLGNYSTGKFNLYGSYGYRQDYRKRTSTVNSESIDTVAQSSTFMVQNSEGNARPRSHLARLGADWTPDGKNSAGLSGTMNYRTVTRDDITGYLYQNDTLAVTEDFTRSMNGEESETDVSLNGYYEHLFDKETDSKLRFDTDFQHETEDEDDNYTNIYTYPLLPETMSRAERKNKVSETNILVTYNRPLWQRTELETGYEGNFEITDQNQQVFDYDPDSAIWKVDPDQENRYHSDQSVHALFTTFNLSGDRFSFMAGLRAEQALNNLDFLTLDTTAKNRYFALYPTLHLGYSQGNGEWQLNYSRRVNRPDGDDMNPVPEYRDPRNIFVGNPDLKPEDIHAIEAGFSFRNDQMTLVPTLFYRIKVNGFSMVSYSLNDSVLVTTIDNVASDQSAGLDFSGTWKPVSFLNLNGGLSGFYSTLDASNIGYSSKQSTFSWNFKLNASFSITKTTLFQLNGQYRSEMLTAQGTRSPFWVVNLGFRQDFWKKKLSLVLTASDLFSSMRMQSRINSPELVMETTRKRDGLVVYGGVVFNIGSNGKKAKDAKFEYDNSQGD
jgi:outer membrane receptor protein involved in Fe transport